MFSGNRMQSDNSPLSIALAACAHITSHYRCFGSYTRPGWIASVFESDPE
jgi:hypothetical protein